MTQEQHFKALGITKKIEMMSSHLGAVRSTKDWDIQLTKYGKSDISLKSEFLPISKDDFLSLYISKVEKAISDAENEFNNL